MRGVGTVRGWITFYFGEKRRWGSCEVRDSPAGPDVEARQTDADREHWRLSGEEPGRDGKTGY